MFLNKKWLLAVCTLASTLAGVAHAGDSQSTLRVSPGANVCLLDDNEALNSVLAVGTVQPGANGVRKPIRFRVRRSLTDNAGSFTTADEEVTTDLSFVGDAVTRSDLIPGFFRLCALNTQSVPVWVMLELRTS